MNKLMIALFAVLLAGAGCTTRTDVDVTTQPEMNVEDEQPQVEAITAEEESDVEVDAEVEGDLSNDMIDEVVPDVRADADADVDVNLKMTTGNFFFDPSTINAKAGQTVNVTIESNSGFHDFSIDEIGFKKTVTAGETITFTAPTTPGSYEFYCSIGSHKEMGMKGTLIVE